MDDVKPRRAPPRAADYLDGKSPSQRGKEKLLRVIVWVHRWGVTDAGIIKQVAGIEANGYATKLARQGWLKTRLLPGGKRVFGLTERAVALASRAVSLDWLDVANAPTGHLEHDLQVQRLVLHLIQTGWSVGEYKSERELATGAAGKRPDALVRHSSGKWHALELELTPKFGRALDEFRYRICVLIQAEEADGVLVVCGSENQKNTYAKAFAAGTAFGIWEKGASGKYCRTGSGLMPLEVTNVVLFAPPSLAWLGVGTDEATLLAALTVG